MTDDCLFRSVRVDATHKISAIGNADQITKLTTTRARASGRNGTDIVKSIYPFRMKYKIISLLLIYDYFQVA